MELGRGCNRMDWAPDGSLFVGQTKHTWAGGEGIQQVSWNGEIPFEIQDMKLQEKGFKFTFTKPVDREIAMKKETWPFSRYFYEYREAYRFATLQMRLKWKFRPLRYPKDTLKR